MARRTTMTAYQLDLATKKAIEAKAALKATLNLPDDPCEWTDAQLAAVFASTNRAPVVDMARAIKAEIPAP